MSRSSARATLRNTRKKTAEKKLSPEQLKDADRARQYVAFGGKRGTNKKPREFEDFKNKENDMSKREEQTLRAKLRLHKKLEDAAKTPIRGKTPHVKQPGQLKKSYSKETHSNRVVSAQMKRERKAAKRGS